MPLNGEPHSLDNIAYPTPDPAPNDPTSCYESDIESVADAASDTSLPAAVAECPCGAAAVILALKKRIKELEKALASAEAQIKVKDLQIKNLNEKLQKKKYQPWSTPEAYKSPMKITFARPNDTLHRRKLPDYFYRALHENSATLSCYTSNACWDKTRERASVLKKSNAFQSLGDFALDEHLNKQMAVRHLNWNQKRPSTVYVSVYDTWDMAQHRAIYHYEHSPVISRRVSVARIKTAGLVPAFFETIHQDKPVKIPIWMRGRGIPEDLSPIHIDVHDNLLMKKGTEIWLSIQDNWRNGLSLRPEGRRGQFEEWLALGHILKSSVDAVYPYDGKQIHMLQVAGVVTSEVSKIKSQADKDWEYDWESWIWRSQEEMSEIKRTLKREKDKKRNAPADDSETPESSKRPKFTNSE